MNTFEYKRTNHGVMIRGGGGDIQSLAAEVGYLAHELYSTLMRKDPMLGEAFKHYVILAMMDPDTPTWNVSERSPGAVEIVMGKPKRGGQGE